MTDKTNKLTDTLKRPLTYLQHLWWSRQRRIDIKVLWPTLRKYTQGDTDLARSAFMLYASTQRSWIVLGEDKAKRIIGNLPL